MGVRDRISASLTEIRTRGQKLVELNVELLKAELKKKAQEYGGAIGMLAAAGLLALYALGFLLATIVVALALFLPTWLALLIVTLVLFLIVAILVLAGRSKLRKLQAAPPPQASAEAKTTVAAVKDGAARTAKSLRPTKKAAPELGETPAPAPSESPAPTTGSWSPPAADVKAAPEAPTPETLASSVPEPPANGETPPDTPSTQARP
jgi:large-conductance mechanosensitive channel